MRLSDLFYLQKSDRRILFFLLSLATIAITAIFFLGSNVTSTSYFDKDSTSVAQDNGMQYTQGSGRWRGRQQYERRYGGSNSYIYNNVERRQKHLTTFDPNTADSTQLLSLGLAPWQVRSIYKYRAAGGVYRTPDDFARLYGMTRKQFEELKPYIRISDDYQPATYVAGSKRYNHYNPYDPQDRDTLLHPTKIRPNEKIVLNNADTTTLKKVPGIGSGWARTIASYGKYLGGYVSVEQLQELENFPEELLGYFTVKNPTPKKLKINELPLSQLKKHPYINFYQARAITDYRRLNGKLKSLSQLKLLKEFTEENIQRLEPYVEY